LRTPTLRDCRPLGDDLVELAGQAGRGMLRSLLANPKPFVWTKPAEAILTKLDKLLYHRIICMRGADHSGVFGGSIGLRRGAFGRG
jgi:hypothetical protein